MLSRRQRDFRARLRISPALEAYQNSLLVELWKRPGLTPRDRGIVTLGGDARSACARAYLLRNQL